MMRDDETQTKGQNNLFVIEIEENAELAHRILNNSKREIRFKNDLNFIRLNIDNAEFQSDIWYVYVIMSEFKI